MTPFESAVEGELEGSRGGRTHVHYQDDHGDRATPLSGTQLLLGGPVLTGAFGELDGHTNMVLPNKGGAYRESAAYQQSSRVYEITDNVPYVK